MATKHDLAQVRRLRTEGTPVRGLAVVKTAKCDVHRYTMSCPPDDCPEAVVDGKTAGGPWANMCVSCFHQHGVGLGTGRGQVLLVSAQ